MAQQTASEKEYNIQADGFELASNVNFSQMMDIVNGEKQNYNKINVTEA